MVLKAPFLSMSFSGSIFLNQPWTPSTMEKHILDVEKKIYVPMRFWKQPVFEFGKQLCSMTSINYCSSLIYNLPGLNIFEFNKRGVIKRPDLSGSQGRLRKASLGPERCVGVSHRNKWRTSIPVKGASICKEPEVRRSLGIGGTENVATVQHHELRLEW